MNTIGERIIFLRERQGISQKELARQLGITAATLSRYENNLYDPKGEIIVRLSNSLQTSADYLLGITSDYRQRTSRRGAYLADSVGPESADGSEFSHDPPMAGRSGPRNCRLYPSADTAPVRQTVPTPYPLSGFSKPASAKNGRSIFPGRPLPLWETSERRWSRWLSFSPRIPAGMRILYFPGTNVLCLSTMRGTVPVRREHWEAYCLSSIYYPKPTGPLRPPGVLVLWLVGDYLTVSAVDPKDFVITDSHILELSLERGADLDPLKHHGP